MRSVLCWPEPLRTGRQFTPGQEVKVKVASGYRRRALIEADHGHTVSVLLRRTGWLAKKFGPWAIIPVEVERSDIGN